MTLTYSVLQVLLAKLSALSMTDWMHIAGYVVIAIFIFEFIRLVMALRQSHWL